MFGRSNDEIDRMVAGFRQKAQDLGLQFGQISKIFNTRLAQELSLWAFDQGKGEQFHFETFKAYLVEEMNLHEKRVLLGLVEKIGLPTGEAEKVLESRRYKKQVDQDWEEARRLTITAVPTMIHHTGRLVGAQPYERMIEFASAIR